MKKQIAFLLLAALLAALLCACGDSGSTAAAATAATTAPTTEATTAPTSPALTAYEFKCVDEKGTPVPNVKLQICTEERCELAVTDSSGIVTYSEPAAAYEVHVLVCPAGYSYDRSAVYTTSTEYEAVTFTLNTAN